MYLGSTPVKGVCLLQPPNHLRPLQKKKNTNTNTETSEARGPNAISNLSCIVMSTIEVRKEVCLCCRRCVVCCVVIQYEISNL